MSIEYDDKRNRGKVKIEIKYLLKDMRKIKNDDKWLNNICL